MCLYALCALGILCTVGLIPFLVNRQPPASVLPSIPDDGKAQVLPHPARKSQYTAIGQDIPIVALPIPRGNSGAAITPERSSLQICLLDAMTGMPVTAGRIAIREEQSGQTLGEYELGSLNCIQFQIDPGKYLFQAGGEGYMAVEQSISINPQDYRTRRVFSLFRRVLVRGIVRDSAGRPQAGALVSLFQETYHVTVKSNAAGRFEAELSNPEIQKIYAFRPPHPIVSLGPVVINGSANPNLEITLPQDSRVVRISGTVFDDLGHPAEDAEAILIPSFTYHVADKQHDAILQGLQQVSAKTDAYGRFSLEALPQSDALLTVSGVKGCELASDSVVLKGNIVRDIHLRCHPTFSVSVEKEDGSQVPDAVIVGESQDGEQAIMPVQEKGRYFAVTYPFRIFAWAFRQGQDGYGVTRSEWIKSYRDSIRLVLGNARVDGSVRNPSGEPIRHFSVRLLTEYASSAVVSFPFITEDGSFSLKYLPPGRVTLEVVAEVAGPDGTRVRLSFSGDLVLIEGQPAFFPAVLKPPDRSFHVP